MFLVLHSHFCFTMIVVQIMLNIPLAFIGGLFLTWLLVGKVSIAILVGLSAVAGTASRNTIMIITHYIHLMEFDWENFGEKMIVRGSLKRHASRGFCHHCVWKTASYSTYRAKTVRSSRSIFWLSFGSVTRSMQPLVCWWMTTSAKDLSALRTETT